MKSPVVDLLFGSRRNRRRQKDFGSKVARRRMFLESLESRAMMAVAGDDGSEFSTFEGNYYPPSTFQASGLDFLSPAQSGDPANIGIGWLVNNAGSFGLSASDFSHYQITSQDETENGVTHVYLQQWYNGLPIADAHASVSVTSSGRVVAAAASFVPGLNQPAVPTPLTPQVSALSAVNLFAYEALLTADGNQSVVAPAAGRNQKTMIAAPGFSLDNVPAELHYVPKEGGGVQLAWRVVLRTPGKPHWYDGSVGAEGDNAGYVIRVADWVDHASYNVFAQPLRNPGEGPRTIVTNPQNAIASPLGWHNDGRITYLDTRGNNVFAQEDTNGDDLGGLRPIGGPTLDFDSPLVLPGDPSTFTEAAVTNVFYWTNLVHDISLRHGFTERAGNFQMTNLTGQGNGSDPVIADVQDPIAIFNAFMATPSDGFSPRLTMGIDPFTIPFGDFSLLNDVIVHEYTHGISNRLTGGRANANALDRLQSGGMGEGWSDWLGILLTLKPTDTRDTPQFVGDFLLPGGFRRFPYSFDMTVNPLRLGNYNGDFFPQQNNTEVHNSGEIWAQTLLDMSWLLIEKHGFSNNLHGGNGGQNVAMRLVFEGMKLQPSNPTFTQARDAILAADRAIYGGDNFIEIWTAFARRGFGIHADSGPNADSLLVDESFVMPNPPARASGTVFHDRDGDGNRDAGEPGLAGWTVYIDANNNAQLDSGERRTTTNANGNYSFNVLTSSQLTIRQVVMPEFVQIAPGGPNGAHVVTAGPGDSETGLNFANQEAPGEIRGIKWNDLNGDGVRDPNEPVIQGVMIYVDLNNDGRIGLMEPAGVTDIAGRYSIRNVQPGTHTVREVFQPGLIQTFPDPAGSGAHTGVVVTRGAITSGINFGNQTAIDFGDAPNAVQSGFPKGYPTLLSQNGARHGVLPGFGLGATVDAEQNGQPTNDNATGDGADDSDGVVLVGITPGESATAIVSVQVGTAGSGVLHGWIDWNRDGDWNDAGEKIISNVRLGNGVHNVRFAVPSSATLGATYARFRFGFESNLGPTGAALAGEVEDYRIDVLANMPVARDDNFGGQFGPPLIKQGSVDNVLDVLANDFGITVGGTTFPPLIDLATLPATSTGGGTIEVQFDPVRNRNVILYTPAAGDVGLDSFQYRVSANGIFSSFATVTIDITAGDPRAVDDLFTVAPGALNVLLPVMQNDVFPNPDTEIISVQVETPGIPASTISINDPANNQLVFSAPIGFTGTIIYQYTIDDSDPNTSAATGRVTVQVGNTPAPSHLARLSVEILDLTGTETSMINLGEDFLVRLTATDLRAPAAFDERGVIAAYADLLFPSGVAQPVADPNNPFGIDITWDLVETSPPIGTFTVQATPSPTATSFASNAAGGDNALESFYVEFTTGALAGQRAQIINFEDVGDIMSFAPGDLTGAPAPGDTFSLIKPRYTIALQAEANVPAPGSINDAGGTFEPTLPPEPHGLSPGPSASVFTIRFRPTATGTFTINPEHADVDPDGNDFTQILLVNPADPLNPDAPIGLTDEQVFLVGDSATIVSAFAGEFTNRRDPLDVNDDDFVSPIDALLVINDLNANGGRELSQVGFAVGGVLPPSDFLDVSVDGHISPLDALLVINHLNRISGQTGGGAAAEGESSAAPLAAATTAPAPATTFLAAADATAPEGEAGGGSLLGASLLLQDAALDSLLGESASTEDGSDDAAESSFQVHGGEAAAVTLVLNAVDDEEDSLVTRSKEVLEEAADELFARLAEAPRLEGRTRLARV